MKPDYGAHLHAQGTSPALKLMFYHVPVDHITLTDVPCLTTMLTKLDEGVEYALSFDFTDEAAAQLLARSPDEVRGGLRRAAAAALPRERTVPIMPAVVANLEATLGPLQQSASEAFAPLIVQRLW